MTSTTGHKPARNASRRGRRAFTLVELILVMAMLVIVIGLAFPTLKAFFRGRVLTSEAHRFLSMTHYAQSRAVSEGVPMVLWIDEQERRYGVEMAEGYQEEEDPKTLEFEVHEDLELEITAPAVRTVALTATAAGRPTSGLSGRLGLGKMISSRNNGITDIRFQPDGTLDPDSPERIVFRDTQNPNDAVGVLQSAYSLQYEIETNVPPNLRR